MTTDTGAHAVGDPGDPLARRILDAAVEEFGTFGVRRTTMDDVASRAGVSRATLYRRFAGRDDVVRATVQREMAAALAELEVALRTVERPVDRFVDGFVGILRAVRGHPLLRRLLADEPEVVLPQLTLRASPIMTMCRDWLADELAVATPRARLRDEGDPAVVAELLVRLSHSLWLTPEGCGQADDEARLREMARRYLVPGWFPRG